MTTALDRVFFSLGLIFNYHIFSGPSNDYFGAFITLAMPIAAAFIFLRHTTVTFNKTCHSVLIVTKPLLRPSISLQCDLSSVNSIQVSQRKGGTSLPGAMGPRLILCCKNEDIPISTYGSLIYGSKKSRSVVATIN